MRDEILRIARYSGEESQLKHLMINSNLSLLRYYNVDVYLYFIFAFLAGVGVALCFINFEIVFVSSYKRF